MINEQPLAGTQPGGALRVALVTNVLSHYRVPCLDRLSDSLAGRLTVFLLARSMNHRDYVMASGGGALPLCYLRGWRWSRPPYDDRHLNDPRPVFRQKPDLLILGGWDEPTYLLLWAWAVMRRKKILFWIESTAQDRRRVRFKEAFKRLLLRWSSGCLVSGSRPAGYCKQLGVPADRIFTASNAADRQFFRSRADRLLPHKDRLRSEAGLTGLVVLFVGRLVERFKGIATLIEACSLLQREGLPASLLLAGDGPDLESYRRQIAEARLNDARFLGTVDHETLCRHYAMADVLVLPSRSEPWGFVLNEGMEFGLPLVVSDAVGAGPDLVRDGQNGFTVPVGDAAILAAALRRLADDPDLRATMGDRSREIVESFSPENWAAAMAAAIEAV